MTRAKRNGPTAMAGPSGGVAGRVTALWTRHLVNTTPDARQQQGRSPAVTTSSVDGIQRTAGMQLGTASAIAAALVVALALPARAVDCAPADRECRLAVAVIRLDADLAVEQARTDRLTRELAACRATQGVCQPLPPPEAYPWRDVVAAGAVGIAVGVVVAVLLTR